MKTDYQIRETIFLPWLNLLFLATPVVIDYMRITMDADVYAWRAVYVFGFRVAAWRKC